jgi:hypothetical protein
LRLCAISQLDEDCFEESTCSSINGRLFSNSKKRWPFDFEGRSSGYDIADVLLPGSIGEKMIRAKMVILLINSLPLISSSSAYFGFILNEIPKDSIFQ